MAMTEKQKEADKRYRDKVKPLTFAISYKSTDMEEGKKLQSYLERTGQSANSYIKGLIKRDLDEKDREEKRRAENTDYEEKQEFFRQLNEASKQMAEEHAQKLEEKRQRLIEENKKYDFLK